MSYTGMPCRGERYVSSSDYAATIDPCLSILPPSSVSSSLTTQARPLPSSPSPRLSSPSLPQPPSFSHQPLDENQAPNNNNPEAIGRFSDWKDGPKDRNGRKSSTDMAVADVEGLAERAIPHQALSQSAAFGGAKAGDRSTDCDQVLQSLTANQGVEDRKDRARNGNGRGGDEGLGKFKVKKSGDNHVGVCMPGVVARVPEGGEEGLRRVEGEGRESVCAMEVEGGVGPGGLGDVAKQAGGWWGAGDRMRGLEKRKANLKAKYGRRSSLMSVEG